MNYLDKDLKFKKIRFLKDLIMIAEKNPKIFNNGEKIISNLKLYPDGSVKTPYIGIGISNKEVYFLVDLDPYNSEQGIEKIIKDFPGELGNQRICERLFSLTGDKLPRSYSSFKKNFKLYSNQEKTTDLLAPRV